MKKSLGQHLLTNKNILSKIIAASGVSGKDLVLEIGAGTGLLTKRLAENCKKVVAVELDRSFETNLKSLLKTYPNAEIVFEDFLRVGLDKLLSTGGKKWTVVANPPYNIASQIIIKLLNNREYFKDIFLTIQKEVADRICASPGTSQYGVLTLLVGLNARPKRLFNISRGSFFPIPKVDSAFIKITPLKKKGFKVNEETLLKIIKSSFGQRRKKIFNALKSLNKSKEELGGAFLRAKIDPNRRGETLSMEEFVRLTKSLPCQTKP